MSTSASIKLAVSGAQAIMKIQKPGLIVDGHWGSFTQSIYTSLSDLAKLQIDVLLQAQNAPTASQLYARNVSLKAMGSQEYLDERAESRALRASPGTLATFDANLGAVISEVDLFSIFDKVEQVTGVTASTLKAFLALESHPPATINGLRMYRTDVVNKSGYRGLFQFDKKGAAWDAASKISTLPPFESNWQNAYYMSLAAANYVLANTKSIRRMGYTGVINGDLAYLMHNQGAAGAYRILTGKSSVAGKQSDKAVLVAERATKAYASFA